MLQNKKHTLDPEKVRHGVFKAKKQCIVNKFLPFPLAVTFLVFVNGLCPVASVQCISYCCEALDDMVIEGCMIQTDCKRSHESHLKGKYL